MHLTNKIFHFKNQSVRDLAWAIDSIPLIEKNFGEEVQFFNAYECKKYFEEFLPVLKELDKKTDILEKYLHSKNSKLIGKRFEHLIEFWLDHSPKFELSASGLQVFDGQRTIGEFDFIYLNKETNKFTHLEVAGKFYLWNGKSLSFENFAAPNFKDNLQKKINSILGKQILLSETEQGKSLLRSIGIKEVVKKVCFKGYIFYPLFYELPKIFPVGHSHGFWLHYDEIEKLEGEYWLILERGKWISPVCCENNYLTRNDFIQLIKRYFTSNNYPLLVVKLAKEKNYFVEETRYFLVHESF